MPTEGRFFVYILASRKYGALYVGVTGNLPGRVESFNPTWRDLFEEIAS